MINHILVNPVDKLDHADNAEATEKAKGATNGPNLVYKSDFDVPLHICHGWLRDLNGNLGNVPFHLGSDSVAFV